MMEPAIADYPQVYDEYDDNVLMSATLHGCRALEWQGRPEQMKKQNKR